MSFNERFLTDSSGYWREKTWTAENGKTWSRVDLQQHFTNCFYSFYFVNGSNIKTIKKS